jgi:multidrug efflux pump subunit AcrB
MMRISEYAVRHPQLTIVVFLMAVALGVTALRTIPLSEDPVFPVSASTVVVVYPGATPADMEQLVVDKLETKFNSLDGLKSLKTTIEDGLSVTEVEFDASTDPEKKYDQVVREVNALRPQLPQDLYRLDVHKWDLSNVNILQVALVSDALPYAELEAQARHLKDRLERVPGIRAADRWAYPAREVSVQLDPGRLTALHLSAAQVMQAIQSDNGIIPGGSADAGLRALSVKTSGGYRDVDQVRNTVVGGNGRAIVTLGDVADVRWSHADLRHIGRWNGHRAAFVTAEMKSGRRISDVRDASWKVLDGFEKTLPAGMTLQRPFDQSVNVNHRLARLAEDFVLAILLVLVTLLPLGTRASLVVMISIPTSLAIGVVLLQLTGFSINQLSIVGFVIALGLLVDDSIVVVENIARFLRLGMSREEAAVAATKQIAVAVVGCTATLVAAFIPMFMLPGTPGKYIRSLPAAVTYTILASLVVSLTLVPFLASRILSRTENPEGNRILQWLNGFIDRTYGRWLRRALDKPRRTLLATAALVVLSASLVPAIGFSLFPKADTPQFLVRVTTPQGASLGATDRVVRWVEQRLRGRPEVRDVLANVGHGNPSVYYNVQSENEHANFGELFVTLREYDTRRTPAMLDSLQAEFARCPDARIELKAFENGPPIDAPIAMRIAGDDLDTLRVLAADLQRTLERTPGTWNVVNPLQLKTTGVRVHVDTHKAGLLGVPTVTVDRMVRLALAGAEAGSVREADGQDYAIHVRLPVDRVAAHSSPSLDGAPSLEALDRLVLPSVTGASVPLHEFASVRLEASTPMIQHYARQRSVTVTSNVRTGFNTDRVTRAVLATLATHRLPPGYRVIPAGEIESRQESFGGLGSAIILTVFIVLAILILEFGTFRSTLIVASVIPLGIVGGLFALFLCRYTLSFTAMIGFIALMGIVIKNSILLVDFTQQLQDEGVPLREAVERAGKTRFLPILLTTLTAIGGLLPLAIQNSSLYSPLAMVIIGGLLSSTLLACIVTPVMVVLLAGRQPARPAPRGGHAPEAA